MSEIQKTILIVDDQELNRAMLHEMFYQDYRVLEASNGREALALIADSTPGIDIILLDVVMPVLDGFGVLDSLRDQGLIEHLPVVLITAENSEGVMKKGYMLGVTDIISKPFNPDIVRRRVQNVLALYSRQETLELLVAQQTQALRRHSRLLVDALSNIIEFKNMDSGRHSLRIRLITKFLLTKLAAEYSDYSLSPVQIELISEAAAMHDIGKITVPDEIINKPGRLTKDEFEIMKTHAAMGCEVAKKLNSIRSPEYMEYCYDICRHHHERWDGNGYPDGLKGEEISIWAQTVSIADVYDALTNERVYKKAFSHETALSMILNGECGAFNPRLLACLAEHAQQMLTFLSQESEQENPAPLLSPPPKHTALSDRTLRLLELEREKYRLLADMSGDIIFDYDVSHDILTFSEKFHQEFAQNSVIEDAYAHLHSSPIIWDDDKGVLSNAVRNLSEQAPMYKTTVRLKTPGNGFEWYEVFFNSIWDTELGSECLSIMGKLVNVNERERLRQKAVDDSLTGIYNRAGLEERITDILCRESGQPATLCFIDVDNFKQVNDRYGHKAGDELLQKVAQLLQSCVRSSDIVGRIGGDEFVILLRGIQDYDLLCQKIEQICMAICSQKECDVSVSIGVARAPQDGTTLETLLQKADCALYQSKRSGKNRFSIYLPDASKQAQFEEPPLREGCSQPHLNGKNPKG